MLVAISIPIFNAQLEKARESTDVANARDYYAEISTALVEGSLSSDSTTMKVSGGLTATATYNSSTKKLEKVSVEGTTVHQKVYNTWESGNPEIGGYKLADSSAPANASANKITYTYSEDAGGHIYLSGVAWES